jgi:hypothetical protein
MGPKVAKGNYLQEPRFWSSFSSQRDELTLRSSTKGGASMSTYVSLVNWTEQGIKNYKDTASRTESCSGTLTDYPKPCRPGLGQVPDRSETTLKGAGHCVRTRRGPSRGQRSRPGVQA